MKSVTQAYWTYHIHSIKWFLFQNQTMKTYRTDSLFKFTQTDTLLQLVLMMFPKATPLIMSPFWLFKEAFDLFSWHRDRRWRGCPAQHILGIHSGEVVKILDSLVVGKMILKQELCIVCISWKRLILYSIGHVIHHLQKLQGNQCWEHLKM